MYLFGDFVLDTRLFQLRLHDEVIPLEPKVYDVLRYLVEHSDRVATKRELLDALWPNEVVTEAVLPTNINALRRALGQKRGERSPIETVHGRGYRFSAPVARAHPPRASMRPTRITNLGAMSELEPDDDQPFVGQSVLLRRLKRNLVRALGEQGQVCVLSGEAGIGKTRIAQRTADLARAHGADLWTGMCPEGAGTPPLWVWQQLIRCALHSDGAECLRAWLGPGAADLGAFLPELEGAQPPESLERRGPASFRTFDAILRVLTRASLARPRVLWLEDMHRADDASWQVLRLLAPQLERLPVMLIVTVRSRDDLTIVAPLQKNLDELARIPFCHAFYVRGLEEAETHELAQSLLGRELDADLVRVLHEKTGGNPLFIRELSEWLDACARFDVGVLRDAPDLAPPDMVRHVLRRRVARLGPEAQRVLEAGAVLGFSWDLASVERVSGLTRDGVLAALDAALHQRIVIALPNQVDGYRFAHDLLRDTLCSDLSTRTRKRMHLLAAKCFEERAVWLGLAGVREVAQHLYQALPEGDALITIAWLARAAELLEEAGAFEDTARMYRCALDATRLLPAPDPELSEALGSARQRAAQLASSARRS